MNERRKTRGAPAIFPAAWLAICACALGSGCAVGPNFERPKPPAGQSYDIPDKSGKAGAVNTQLAPGGDIPAKWWQLFKSPSLDDTLRAAIADSPTLASAQASLAAAREAVIVAWAGYLPRLNAGAGAERSGSAGTDRIGNASSTASSSTGGTGTIITNTAAPVTVDSLGLTASYSFNAFGGATARTVEQQQALADMQRYQVAGAYLTLTGGVVTQALTVASTRLQIAITVDLLANDQKNLDLTNRMFEVGAAARTDVLTAESQLASDETTLPALRQQLNVSSHALAILVGHAPGDWRVPDFELAEFNLPADVPLSLPSALVRQRPDILAAEAQLHAASAAIGIAVANEYPAITLSASLTRDALTPGNLFRHFESLWNFGGEITQPLFAGGALRAQTRAARDAFQAQAFTYTEVVLSAFGQVSDDLRALEHDAERVTAFARSLRIAQESLELQRVSYAAGRTTILQLIDAERTYSQARLGRAGAEVQQLEDAANLFVALGGGWWNSTVTPPAARASFVPTLPFAGEAFAGD